MERGSRTGRPQKPNSRMYGWREFTRELESQMVKMPCGEYMIIEVHGKDSPRNAYVQFRITEDGHLWCEAVSNVHIVRPDYMDDVQIKEMQKLGWKDPGYVGNWWREFRGVNKARTGSRLLVKSVRNVYGAVSPADLRYRSSVKIKNFSIKEGINDTQDATKKPNNKKLDLSALGHVNYGRSAEGVYTFGLYGEYMRISVENLAAVDMMQAAIRIGHPAKRRQVARILKHLKSIAYDADEYQVRYAEDEQDKAFWLIRVRTFEKEEATTERIGAELIDMIRDVKWPRAILDDLAYGRSRSKQNGAEE